MTVDLATDARAAAYAGAFPARRVHIIPSETIRSGSPLALAKTAYEVTRGTFSAWRLLGRLKPAVVVGFGGYPTVPPMLAAAWRKIPTLVHEQNAVMGRANRLLASRVTAIATGFAALAAVPGQAASKLRHTGNPVRHAVVAAAQTPYPTFAGPIRILVFGGSQGARIMSDVVPEAIARLDPALRSRIALTQQARQEDCARVEQSYARAGVAGEIAPFFKDLPARMAAAHLVIARGGASTVAELAAIGRPSILVPLPGALDQDQAANARALAEGGGARLVMQADFTADRLAKDLAALLSDPAALAEAAAAAKRAGTIDAADRLARIVQDLASAKA